MNTIEFRSELSQRFADYWFSLPRDDLLPRRETFDPAAVPELLPMILLRDVLSDGRGRYRLAGTGIRDMLGFEITGLKAFDFLPEPHQALYREVSRQMMDRPCGVNALFDLQSARGEPFQIENVAFPFAPRADGSGQTVGHFAPLGLPRQIGGGTSRVIAIGAMELIDLGAGLPDINLP